MSAIPKAKSEGEERFTQQMRALGADEGMEPEHRFAAIASGGIGKGVRKRLEDAGMKDWRFDFAWPDILIAVEIEGVLHKGKGRHQTVHGLAGDCAKYNAATLMGWRVYRFTPAQVRSGLAYTTMQKAFIGIRRLRDGQI